MRNSRDTHRKTLVSSSSSSSVPHADLREAAEIKAEILAVVKWIDNERQLLDKISVSATKLADTLTSTAKADLGSIRHRLKEVNVMLDVQTIKRQSLKYNEDIVRAYANSAPTAPKSKLVNKKTSQSEHFKRKSPSTVTKKTMALSDSRASPWEGSEYKYTLVVSLKHKLLLKLVFNAFVCYRQMKMNSRQAVLSAARLRTRKLLQLCFRSIQFDALSVRYIELNSSIKCDMFLRSKFVEPGFARLHRALVVARQYREHHDKAAERFYRCRRCKAALQLLRSNNVNLKRLRALRVWSRTKGCLSVLMKGFLAWTHVFVHKNEVRASLRNQLAGEAGQVLSKTSSDRLGRSILADVKLANADPLGLRRGRGRAAEADGDRVSVQDYQDALFDYSIASIRGMKRHIAEARHYKSGQRRRGGRRGDSSLLVDTLYREFFVKDYSCVVDQSSARSSGRSTDSDEDSVMSTDSLHRHSSLTGLHSKRRRRARRPEKPSAADPHTRVLPLPSIIPTFLREHLSDAVHARKLYVLPPQTATKKGPPSSGAPHTSRLEASVLSSIGGAGASDDLEEENYRLAVSGDYSLLDHHSDTSSNHSSLLGVDLTHQTVSHTPHRSLNRSSVQRSGIAGTPLLRGGSVVDRALELSTLVGLPPVATAAASPVAATSTSPTPSPPVAADSPEPSFDLTFCGPVTEADSDFESNALNTHYDIGSTEIARRKALFVEGLTTQFQLMRINWLVRRARLFVTTLRRRARLAKAVRLAKQCLTRSSRRRSYLAWQQGMAKCRKEAELCFQIYSINLGRRVIRAWFDWSVTRLWEDGAELEESCRLRQERASFRGWREYFRQVRQQRTAVETVQRVVMGQVWSTWRHLVRDKRRVMDLYRLVVLGRLGARWSHWMDKFRRRRLLKSVFALCDTAWSYRCYFSNHHFYLLYNIFSAWAVHTRRVKRLAASEEKVTRALYFRGVSLLVRYYFKWVDHISRLKRVRHFVSQQSTRRLRSTYRQWARCLHLAGRVHNSAHSHYHHMLCRRVFRQWKGIIKYLTSDEPMEFRTARMVRDCFDAWRVLGKVRLAQHRLEPRQESRLLLRTYKHWRRLYWWRQRVRRGVPHLSDLYYRLKMRQAFLTWPGRQECLRARDMLKYIQMQKSRGGHRMRLVDVDQSAKVSQVQKDRRLMDDERRKDTEAARSFVQQVRPTIAARAVAYRFVQSEHDVDGISYCFELVAAVLKEWRAVVKSARYYHGLAMRVRAERRRQLEKIALRHWIKLTPATTHRSITWIHKRNQRKHDDYLFHLHDQQQRDKSNLDHSDGDYRKYLASLRTVAEQSLLMPC